MKRKLRNIGWIFILLILSVPVGYVHLVVHDKMLVLNEYILNIIIGSIATIFVLGGISFVTYKILKKKQFSDPSKIALITYTVLLFLIFITSVFQYNEALTNLERF